MNDDFEIVGDDTREARIVAVILGEASDFEREEIERLCEENPELQVFRRRIEAVHGLLGESPAENLESQSSRWQLSKERRAAVLEKLGEKETMVAGPQHKKARVRPYVWQAVACAGLAVLIILGVSFQKGMQSLSTSQFEQSKGIERELVVFQAEEALSIPKETSDSFNRPSPSRAASVAKPMSEVAKPQVSPSPPSSSPAKAIAANTVDSAAIPVPEVSAPAPALGFGDSDDFGTGWGAGDAGRGGGAGGGYAWTGKDRDADSQQDIFGEFFDSKPGSSSERSYNGQVDKVPALVDLPVLGALHKSQSLETDRAPSGSDSNVISGGLRSDFSIARNGADGREYRYSSSEDSRMKLFDSLPRIEAKSKKMSKFSEGRETNESKKVRGRPSSFDDENNGLLPTLDAGGAIVRASENQGQSKADQDTDAFAPADTADAFAPAAPVDAFYSGGVALEMEGERALLPPFERDEHIDTRAFLAATDRADDPFASDDEAFASSESFAAESSDPFAWESESVAVARRAEVLKSNEGLFTTGAFNVNATGMGAWSKIQQDDDRRRGELSVVKEELVVDFRKRFESSTSARMDSLGANEVSEVVGGSLNLDGELDLGIEANESELSESQRKGFFVNFGDPIRTNPVLSYEHAEELDEVRRLLYHAEGHSNLGDYDAAEDKLHDVLRVDPYNMAARRGLEKIAEIKSDYYRVAYDQARAELSTEVDAAWEVALENLDGKKLERRIANLEQKVAQKVAEKEKLLNGQLEGFKGEENGQQQALLASETPEYRDARREYESSLADLQELKLKYSAERVGLRVPREPISIFKEAKVPSEKSGFMGLDGYKSEAVVQVNTSRQEPSLELGVLESRQFFATQFEVAKSRKTLEIAAEEQGLAQKWGVSKREAIRRLKDAVEVRQRPGTDLLEFIGKGEEAQEAQEAAEAVSYAYQSRRNREEAQRMNQKLKALDDEVQKQKEKVEGKRKVLDVLAKSVERPYLEGVDQDELKRELQILEEALVKLKAEEQKNEAAKEAKKKVTQFRAMGEKDAAAQGDSTFSLHVSDVSFKLAKAALAQGQWPETIRTEEFVNAFSYDERVLGPNERIGVAMEQAAHPFLSQRNLLRVSLQTAATGRGAEVPLRLTVVLDKSGSMERLDRSTVVDEAFRVLVSQLKAGDRVTLVGFSRTPTLLADFVDGSQGQRLLQILRETPSEGGTNVEEALKLAQAKALEHFEEGAQNRVILLTDGIANLGEAVPKNLMALVEGMRECKVAFDACGVGVEGLNDEILEALTRKGDGRYYLLGSQEESGADFAKQVAGALRPAAQNVKVQIEWNPERVGKWRLYGFEKHELKKEDFRNDSVDAAEMAAEEEGVALYHVEVKPDGEGPLGVARVRFLDIANDEMVEREWEIAHEGEADPLAKADRKVRLAAVAGLTAEKLARSAVGERVEWNELLAEVRQLKELLPRAQRVKDLEEMIEQAKNLE